jgi:hypothetical protein
VSNKTIRERETELWHMREALKSYEARLAQAVKERDAERHAGEALVRQVQARNKHIAEVRALHSECIIERDTAIRQRDALAEHLRTITADNLVPRAELDAAVAERDVAVAEAERMMGNVLCYSISGPPVALIEVMQRRYGRAAHQWKHNHDERKAERDHAKAACAYAIAERDSERTVFATQVIGLKAQVNETVSRWQAAIADRDEWKRKCESARPALSADEVSALAFAKQCVSQSLRVVQTSAIGYGTGDVVARHERCLAAITRLTQAHAETSGEG